jgi:hypothetical protein
MANEEQLKILKQGVEVWNKWREKRSKTDVNLEGAVLSGANLRGVDFVGVDLKEADLNRSDLSGANLRSADFHGANLSEAKFASAILSGTDLRRVNLSKADLNRADLSRANLNRAQLGGVNLKRAYLNRVDFSGADLTKADLSESTFFDINLNKANLSETNFSGAELADVIFTQIDLSKTKGLESISHLSPSHISTDTLQLSKGIIPEAFLRGCGLSDWEIESVKLYKPGLSNEEINNIIYKIFNLRANQSIQISPPFISYSHLDALFVEKLEPYLAKKGIRFWLDVHDAIAGRLEKQVDRAMRQNPTVILILSENSIRSDWVEHEARLARELEKEIGRDVLCPIALDWSWKSTTWPVRLIRQIMEYHILDFSSWRDNESFEKMFNKMIKGLDMFYKPEGQK